MLVAAARHSVLGLSSRCHCAQTSAAPCIHVFFRQNVQNGLRHAPNLVHGSVEFVVEILHGRRFFFDTSVFLKGTAIGKLSHSSLHGPSHGSTQSTAFGSTQHITCGMIPGKETDRCQELGVSFHSICYKYLHRLY